ncbi:glycerate kinase, partial [Propionicimonas sp.]|uniref:glycerate kinase n=1 Tax=Propionicimonas sp. TaxID=1955623 RepID=UPI0039E4D082
DLAVAVGALWGAAAELAADRWLVRGAGRVLLGLREAERPGWAPEASTADIGAWVVGSLRPEDAEVVLDLTGVTAHDSGAGLLAMAGGALAGRRLSGVVPPDERELPATGIGGGLARRAFAARVDISELLAADAVLAARARESGEGLDVAPGGGAAGGTGLAVLSLGGRLVSGTQFCHQAAGLDRTLRAADLVVTACTELSALDRGGPVVTAVAAWAEAAQRPCLLVTSGAGLARRELRTLGIEAAHLLPAGPVTADGLTAVAARIAAGWYVGGGGLA